MLNPYILTFVVRNKEGQPEFPLRANHCFFLKFLS